MRRISTLLAFMNIDWAKRDGNRALRSRGCPERKEIVHRRSGPMRHPAASGSPQYVVRSPAPRAGGARRSGPLTPETGQTRLKHPHGISKLASYSRRRCSESGNLIYHPERNIFVRQRLDSSGAFLGEAMRLFIMIDAPHRSAIATTTPWPRASSRRSNANLSTGTVSRPRPRRAWRSSRSSKAGINPHRRHSSLGQQSPLNYENNGNYIQ